MNKPYQRYEKPRGLSISGLICPKAAQGVPDRVPIRSRMLKYGGRKQFSAERGKCLLESFPKRWNLILDYVPDDVFIKPEVAMREHVTKCGDLSPFDRRVLKANVLWNLLGGFA